MPSWKTVAAVMGLMTLGAATLIGVAYANTPIPTEAQAEAIAQESVIYYRDGKTPIARIGMHRESVPISRIPPVVRHAVLAAEDRNFEHEHGVSPTGVARALFKTATGGDVQGGSTITQQLARNYYQGLSQKRTVSRKLKEILISIRLDGEREKDEILGLYLNTVSFGRQAYGIQAASRAYFHKDVRKLTVSEAAMLAALIQRPGFFVTTGPDTQPAKRALIDRWKYVLDGMVEEGWLSKAERDRQTFPTTERNWSDVPATSQAGYLKERVLNELKRLGVTDEMLETGGLRITTTFDKRLQDQTASLVKQIRKEKGLEDDVHFGLAAVDPRTGGVVAAYGGPSYTRQQFDNSFGGKIQPGSSFKPIVLATALDQGISLRTTMDGAYERTINGDTFTNDARSENGVYTLAQMTEMSINTAYVELGQKVGLENVAEMAKKMGVPPGTADLDKGYTSLPLGTISVSPVTMASVYSTFAAEGKHIPPHVISQVTDRQGGPVRTELGKTLKKVPYKAEEVFSPEVARDATVAMQAVVRSGTGTRASLGARPVAGKTGTTDENKSAWFVGYTPQLATSVAMWRQGEDGALKSLQGIGGYNQIYGGTVPADLFARFMNRALADEEIEQFGPPGDVGTVAPWAVPKPEPTPPPSPSPSPGPTCTPGVPQIPGQPGAEPCVPGAPGPTPGQPTGPPGASVPCDRFGLPIGCDPNVPPSDPPPAWWCDRNPGSPQCSPDGGPGRPRAQSTRP
ncbi:transglycosylase domain-containing protein [Actinomadura rugatobispora]|uniref:Transglycosylase domain-containing protein n=1 Tax=Actinomadura rugatobispora TaxID=1994 RepID=A0ABW0ZNY5_9ACTN|nr:transglycosylase domain-containing protein [Actinomadura rugatobispora]